MGDRVGSRYGRKISEPLPQSGRQTGEEISATKLQRLMYVDEYNLHYHRKSSQSTTRNMNEENEKLLNDSESQQASRRPKGRSWFRTIAERPFLCSYFLLLHILLLISVFGDVSKSDHSPRIICTCTLHPSPLWRIQTNISTVPELRSLRRIVKTEHATNHTLYSNYSGPPNEANAAAWTHLLQREVFFLFYTAR